MKYYFDFEQWLSSLNFFRECFYERSFELFVRYLTGLLISNNKTVDGLNSIFMQKTDQSNLNRFLTEYPWHKNNFTDELKRLFKSRSVLSSFCYFVLDDTLLEKIGKHIESAGTHFDHTSGRYILGHQIVTSGYVFQSGFYPFLLDLYTKEEQCLEEKLVFKTKVQIALEILAKAIEFHKPSIVLIDSWYCTQEIIRFLDDNGIQYIIASKSNRVFVYRSNDEKISDYVTTIQNFTTFNRGDYQFQTKSILAYFEDFGEKRLVFVRRREIGTKEYDNWNALITNIDAPDETIIGFYSNRFIIEEFHKDAKQHLGMGKSQLRKRRGVVKHLHLVAVGYCLLKAATWVQRKWNLFSIPERVRQIKEYFEKNTLIRTIKENKRDILGAINQLFAKERKS